MYPLWNVAPLALAVAVIWCDPRIRLPRTLKINVRVPPGESITVRELESVVSPRGTERFTVTGVEST